MRAIIFDTETTGQVDPVLVEAAYIRLANPTLAQLDDFCQRYNPGKKIELGAMATHHIVDEDLASMPHHSEFRLPDGAEYLIGHNVDYDWKVIGQPDIKRICTLAMCRKLWPEADSHSQSAMIYHLIGGVEARNLLQDAHSALADVKNCLLILGFIQGEVNADSWDELWAFSEAARVPEIMPFGKHKGTPIKDVPWDYKLWLMKQADVDPYLMKAIQA